MLKSLLQFDSGGNNAFLARCHKRKLNQFLPVLSNAGLLSLYFALDHFVFSNFVFSTFRLMVVLVWLSVLVQVIDWKLVSKMTHYVLVGYWEFWTLRPLRCLIHC